MRVKIALISIGNSKGVRLPKAVLEQVGLSEEAEMTIENGRIVLAPRARPRLGWAEAFAACPPTAADDDDDWLDAPLADDFE